MSQSQGKIILGIYKLYSFTYSSVSDIAYLCLAQCHAQNRK